MNTVLIYSGGLDSTVLLYRLLEMGDRVRCLSVDYGQRHRRELESARAICEEAGVEHLVADLSGLSPVLQGSALTSSEIAVPEGHYTDVSMKQTVVPNRNMLLLSVGISWAVSTKADAVAYAAHGGDHTIYPDCRPAFFAAMQAAAELADWHQVSLLAPFITMNKGEIASLGAELGAPLEKTWSCYKGGEAHCGACGTCVERREAFAMAGIKDPTEYASCTV